MSELIYSLEDDIDIARIISTTLTKVGYQVKSFQLGQDFKNEFNKVKPDMVLLDLMLPDCSGIDILKEIKQDSSNDNIQIIIISAKRNPLDKVDGLDSGADDYIEKPFNILELLSRVNARLRRNKNKNVLKYENLEIDLDKHLLKIENKEINLTNMEFEIISYLFKNKGRVISREELFNYLYGTQELESRTLDMHIKSIRKKIDDKESKIIKTIYGVGYILD